MQSWATQELGHAEPGDARLNKRLVKVVEDLAGQPEASVPQACGDWAATKGAYRLWDNAVLKLLYLAAQNVVKKWTVRIPHWNRILAQLAIHFGERMEKYL